MTVTRKGNSGETAADNVAASMEHANQVHQAASGSASPESVDGGMMSPKAVAAIVEAIAAKNGESQSVMGGMFENMRQTMLQVLQKLEDKEQMSHMRLEEKMHEMSMLMASHIGSIVRPLRDDIQF